jgi:hypothetical protein
VYRKLRNTYAFGGTDVVQALTDEQRRGYGRVGSRQLEA